jgi:hypothetical protein
MVMAWVLLAAPLAARVLEVGPGRAYPTPSAAAALAENGDIVRIAPGRYRDCAIWRAHDLVIEGIGASAIASAFRSRRQSGIF